MNISEAQRKAYEKLERKCDNLQKQRNQLREALEEILHDTGSFAAKHIARAALKATEEG